MLTPDKNFVADLKKISDRLTVRWGEVIGRWVIWYKSPDGNEYKVHEVKNEDGSYRVLDNRVLDMLKRCDMSRYVNDPSYIFSEQFRKSKEEKEKWKQKRKEEVAYRSRQLKSKWDRAIDNALYKNIVSDKQIWTPKIFSFASRSNGILLKKLGKPFITGRPSIINP